jgi:hypothetical protein
MFWGKYSSLSSHVCRKSDLEKKLRKQYVGDYLAQVYFIEWAI